MSESKQAKNGNGIASGGFKKGVGKRSKCRNMTNGDEMEKKSLKVGKVAPGTIVGSWDTYQFE